MRTQRARRLATASAAGLLMVGGVAVGTAGTASASSQDHSQSYSQYCWNHHSWWNDDCDDYGRGGYNDRYDNDYGGYGHHNNRYDNDRGGYNDHYDNGRGGNGGYGNHDGGHGGYGGHGNHGRG
ncbi:hypothetical protein ABT099_02410 [Streptomyces prasinus]|uniref:hypothetical protein n=1 Tax=Streptomyces prasinus TaxID=67345 RepID=UPI00331F97E6